MRLSFTAASLTHAYVPYLSHNTRARFTTPRVEIIEEAKAAPAGDTGDMVLRPKRKDTASKPYDGADLSGPATVMTPTPSMMTARGCYLDMAGG